MGTLGGGGSVNWIVFSFILFLCSDFYAFIICKKRGQSCMEKVISFFFFFFSIFV